MRLFNSFIFCLIFQAVFGDCLHPTADEHTWGMDGHDAHISDQCLHSELPKQEASDKLSLKKNSQAITALKKIGPDKNFFWKLPKYYNFW